MWLNKAHDGGSMVGVRVKPYLLFFLGIFLLSVIFPKPVFAEDIVYKINDPLVLPPPSVIGVGRVLFDTNLFLSYTGGKIVVSKNPDGTGGADVGDRIQIINSFPANTIFVYDGFLGCVLRKKMPPTDITNLFRHGGNNLLIRYLDWCGGTKNISSLYIVYTLPEPQAPEPFLDLPWDYNSKGLTFSQAVLAINAFFDHEYPLLSSGLIESSPSAILTRGYDGEAPRERQYSSHDGFDYGISAKAFNGDLVLAAAAGIATYHNGCGACGNAIHIDHSNGYQTRYYHLQSEGLITNVVSQQIPVQTRQPIGKVGATGVSPQKGDPSHIHFMVVHDKNGDGNFEDNIPDGLVDPFGWQSKEKDPWPNFSFFYNGLQRTGSKSYYLWKHSLDASTSEITSQGGEITTANYLASFPQGSTAQNITVDMQSSPMVSITDIIKSLGPSITINAVDVFKEAVTQFTTPFTLTVDFSTLDISRFDPNTLSLYSTSDGTTWTQEQTSVDLQNKTATAQINHLSQFTLAAVRKDTTPPTTTAAFNTAPVNTGQYSVGTQVRLSSEENEGGLGVDYVLYKLDDGDWTTYTNPLAFNSVGSHSVEYYSIDKDENVEEKQSVSFEIVNSDITPPEAEVVFSTNILDFSVTGVDSGGTTTVSKSVENSKTKFIITDSNSNVLTLLTKQTSGALFHRIVFDFLQYNQNQAVVLNNTSLLITYIKSKNKIAVLDQLYVQRGETLLLARYTQIKNKTEIYWYERGTRVIKKEVLDGLRLLKLYTKEGTLKYRY